MSDIEELIHIFYKAGKIRAFEEMRGCSINPLKKWLANKLIEKELELNKA